MVQKISKEREEKVLDLVKTYPLYSLNKLAANLKEMSRHSIQNILEKNNLSTVEKRLEFSKKMGDEVKFKETQGKKRELDETRGGGSLGQQGEVEEGGEEERSGETEIQIKDQGIVLKKNWKALPKIWNKIFSSLNGATFSIQNRRIIISIPLSLLLIISASFVFAKTPAISIEKPGLQEEIHGGKLVVSGKVNPSSSSVWVNGESILVEGNGGFTTIVDLPKGESVLNIEAENKFKKTKTVRLVKRILTDEEVNEQKRVEEDKKKERASQVAQIDRQVNDLLAAKDAQASNLSAGMVKVNSSQLKEEAGFANVEGEVLNMGKKEVAWVMVVAKFFITDGTMVDSKTGFATGFDQTLKPGDTAKFETQATTKTFDRYSLEVTWQEVNVAGAQTEVSTTSRPTTVITPKPTENLIP